MFSGSVARLSVLGSWLGLMAAVSSCASQSTPEVTEASASPSTERDSEWTTLFDGKTLENWEVTDFGGQGEVKVTEGELRLGMGSPMTGVGWKGAMPTVPYEIELEASRREGIELFCGVTFPHKDTCGSLVLGGWGGGVCGVSSIDHMDAANNNSSSYHEFESNRWYKIRLVVEEKRIRAWLDGEELVDVDLTDRKLSVRIDVDALTPMGLFNYVSESAFRGVRWRRFDG